MTAFLRADEALYAENNVEFIRPETLPLSDCSMPKLLIVDDEPSIHHAFQRAFREKNIEIISAKTSAEAEIVVIAERPDAIVLDLHLPDACGLETFLKLRAIDYRTPIILITGHGTTDLAIEAIKMGAFEYLLKPLELAQIRELVHSAIHSSQLMRMPAMLPEESASVEACDQLIGQCPTMQELYKGIGRVAAQDVRSLLLERFISTAIGRISRFLPSTVQQFRNNCSRVNSSVTKRERLPGRIVNASESSSSVREAPFFWTRSGSCLR